MYHDCNLTTLQNSHKIFVKEAKSQAKMSDDEADPELLELLRQSLGISRQAKDDISGDTGMIQLSYPTSRSWNVGLILSFYQLNTQTMVAYADGFNRRIGRCRIHLQQRHRRFDRYVLHKSRSGKHSYGHAGTQLLHSDMEPA